ncbi:ABC transporter substrate-binding protein [Rhodopila sp.]|uniref:ABC transporter substrate-binding protein n=1 Tax=Rhodopila sp. TaxID=2480087 RepID=UPI002C991C8A|nr:ABC transporter substrate-binding protein [Rhodopila sp.]HVZ09906.1 ABC transporter substrate-binding protein [Rhodopila sp.]
MTTMSRRGLIRGSVSLAATSTLARPYIANAQAKTATLWVGQGFVRQEDAALKKTVADYEAASGNKIDYSIIPFGPLGQKIVSALTSGDVPDLFFQDAPTTILPQAAWNNKLVDVTDVVETQADKLSETAKLSATFNNGTTKQRSYYLCPIKQAATPFHIWGDLVVKAGYDLKDAPDTWDAFWDFFKPMQKKLRAQGMRRMFAHGSSLTTVGPNDGNNLFYHFVIANGGQDVVTPDGKLHTDDPKVREAFIKSVDYLTRCYKDGYVPEDVLSWNDSDNNNGFHQKLFIMDFDGTISTELAMIDNKKAYFEESVTMGLPKGNDGKPMAGQTGAGGGYIPKGGKNVDVAKDFMKFFMQPAVMNENLKAGLGRWFPSIPSLIKSDPFWLDPADPHRAPYIKIALGPMIPVFNAYNPAWGQVNAEQLWGRAEADVIKNGMTPEQAVDKAFKRAEEIFTKFTFG